MMSNFTNMMISSLLGIGLNETMSKFKAEANLKITVENLEKAYKYFAEKLNSPEYDEKMQKILNRIVDTLFDVLTKKKSGDFITMHEQMFAVSAIGSMEKDNFSEISAQILIMQSLYMVTNDNIDDLKKKKETEKKPENDTTPSHEIKNPNDITYDWLFTFLNKVVEKSTHDVLLIDNKTNAAVEIVKSDEKETLGDVTDYLWKVYEHCTSTQPDHKECFYAFRSKGICDISFGSNSTVIQIKNARGELVLSLTIVEKVSFTKIKPDLSLEELMDGYVDETTDSDEEEDVFEDDTTEPATNPDDKEVIDFMNFAKEKSLLNDDEYKAMMDFIKQYRETTKAPLTHASLIQFILAAKLGKNLFSNDLF